MTHLGEEEEEEDADDDDVFSHQDISDLRSHKLFGQASFVLFTE